MSLTDHRYRPAQRVLYRNPAVSKPLRREQFTPVPFTVIYASKAQRRGDAPRKRSRHGQSYWPFLGYLLTVVGVIMAAVGVFALDFWLVQQGEVALALFVSLMLGALLIGSMGRERAR